MAWTVDHARRYNTGLVGGKLQLAVLEKRNEGWIAHHEDPETEQQIVALEKYLSEFGKIATNEPAVDVNKALAGEAPIGEATA